MSSGVQATERWREEKKGDMNVKRQRPFSAIPLSPHLATAAPCLVLLISIKSWSGNQRMCNKDFFQHYTVSDTHIKCTLWIIARIAEDVSPWSPGPTGQNENFLHPWELPFWLNIWEISQKTVTLNQYDIASANEILLTSNILWITD